MLRPKLVLSSSSVLPYLLPPLSPPAPHLPRKPKQNFKDFHGRTPGLRSQQYSEGEEMYKIKKQWCSAKCSWFYWTIRSKWKIRRIAALDNQRISHFQYILILILGTRCRSPNIPRLNRCRSVQKTDFSLSNDQNYNIRGTGFLLGC